MAKRAHAADLTVEEIEAKIDQMKTEGARTERWMSSWSRTRMNQLEEKGRSLRDAYEAGYRAGSDKNFVLWLIFGAAMFSAGAFFEFLVVSYP